MRRVLLGLGTVALVGCLPLQLEDWRFPCDAETPCAAGQQCVFDAVEGQGFCEPGDSSPCADIPQAACLGEADCDVVCIDGGDSWQGCAGGACELAPHELPSRLVTMAPFVIQRHEVMDSVTGLPRVDVSWEEARASCQAWGGGLCTESQWERAVRGPCAGAGCEAAAQTAFPWGDQAPDCDLAILDGCGGPVAVGGAGLQHLAGNVREWVHDCWHGTYDDAPTDGRSWSGVDGGDCGRRVVRGGGFLDGPAGARSSHRQALDVSSEAPDLGFRCCAGGVTP